MGGASKSYGIQVAELAGLPKNVISRSKEILTLLEREANGFESDAKVNNVRFNNEKKSDAQGIQLPFPVNGDILKNIVDLDIESMTPLEAMNKLNQIQNKLKKLDGLV